jgi:hypothetical protein
MADVSLQAIGDPEAMRVLARSFSTSAEEIAVRAQELERRFERMAFEGPAADRLRERMLQRRRRAEHAGRELLEAANLLARMAGQVEDEIALAERQQRRLQEGI